MSNKEQLLVVYCAFLLFLAVCVVCSFVFKNRRVKQKHNIIRNKPMRVMPVDNAENRLLIVNFYGYVEMVKCTGYRDGSEIEVQREGHDMYTMIMESDVLIVLPFYSIDVSKT